MIYTKYPHAKIHKRVRHLNNRDLAILFGVFVGMAVGIYGIFIKNFTIAPVLGSVVNQNILFKIMAVILCGGTFGNLLSYVGSCIDIITNYATIFDLLLSKSKDQSI
ncbi:MAG: hypothetical protein ORN24_05485 [Burkholderiales bacterium]|nr:hypothetical protein [Burkholderiales bacterium]